MSRTQINGGTQIQAATITNAEIASAAAIASSKLADGANFLKKDGSVTPTADLPMGNFKLTGLGTPSSSTDAATKAYVDSAAAGIDWKASVRAASTANGTLASAFENGDTLDGVTLATGDRILLKNQSTGAENGIYTVNASGAPTRATDADANAEVTGGMAVFVEEGTANADSGWVLTNNGAVTVGTTALTFTQFTGLGQVTDGNGLTKTGNTLDVNVDSSSIEINSDTLRVKAAGITNAMLAGSIAASKLVGSDIATVGTITSGTWNGTAVDVAHGGTGDTTLTAYAVLTGGTTSTGALQQVSGLGSSGNVLTSNGAGALPTWQAPAAAPNFVTRETPSGSVNGSNTTYTLAHTPTAGSEEVYLNGILQEPGAGNDYTISSGTITYLTAPISGDKIRVNYRY